MLDKSLLKQAYVVGTAVCESGKKISFGNNSLFTDLIEHSRPAFAFDYSRPDFADIFVDVTSQITQGDAEHLSMHEVATDKLIENLKIVTTHIAFARNVVKPAYMHYAEHIKKYIELNSRKNPADEFQIVPVKLPAIMKDSSFVESLETYKSDVKQPGKKFTIKSEVPFKELLITGVNRQDKLIQEFLSELSEEYVGILYDVFFCDSVPRMIGWKVHNFQSFDSMNDFEKIQNALPLYLMSTKLYNTVMSSDMSAGAYRSAMEDYMYFFGNMLYVANKNIERLSKNNILLISVNDKRNIQVNYDIYRPWLEAGGKVEYIYAAVASNLKIYTVDDLNKNADKLRDQWSVYCSFFVNKEKSDALGSFQRYLKQTFITYMDELNDEEKAYEAENQNYRQRAIQLACDEIDELTIESMLNPSKTAMQIIAKCRYYYTDAFYILNCMVEASEENPTIEVREAAWLAVCKYLCRYVASLITVK